MRHRAPRNWTTPPVILLAATALLGGGCGGQTQSDIAGEQPAGLRSRAPQPAAAPAGSRPLIPPPTELTGLPNAPRRSSYAEVDLIRHGQHFAGTAPNRNVAIAGNSVEFSPSWAAPDHLDPANLAFCIYSFLLAGYDRAAEVRYGWEVPPTELGTAWLGLSNWDTKSWDWYQCDSSGLLAVDSFDPYINSIDNMFVAVLQANDEASRLHWIRLGPSVITAELNGSPVTGIAPLSSMLDASDSATAVGTLERYEWDFDGDGVFEADSGSTPTMGHVYPSAGEFSTQVRITDSYGEQALAATPIEAKDGWAHTWGDDLYERVRAICYDGAGALYAAGGRTAMSATDVLLLKYDLDGNLLWARSWGSTMSDEAFGVAATPAGAVFVTGITSSYGLGNGDVLVQRWDSAGNVVWTRTWGGGGYDIAWAACYAAGRVFAAGNTDSFGAGGRDAFVLTFDPDGNFDWAKTVGGIQDDEVLDATTLYQLLPDATSIHLAGSTRNFAAHEEMMYVNFREDGALQSLFTWDAPYRSVGQSISASGFVSASIFLGGLMEDATNQQLFIAQLGPGGIAKTWGGASAESTGDILQLGDSVLLCGYSNSFDTTGRALLLSLSTAGAFQGAETWTGGGDATEFSSLARFPDSGLIVAGDAVSLQDGTWTPVTASLGDALGAWTLQSVSAQDAAATVGSPTLLGTPVTDGVIDTGGGVKDSLVIARQLP